MKSIGVNKKYTFYFFIILMILSPFSEVTAQNSSFQIIIAMDESISMQNKNDVDGKRYNAVGNFTKLFEMIGESLNVKIGIFPFSDRVHNSQEGRINLQTVRHINPKTILRRAEKRRGPWTRIDRVIKQAVQSFNPKGKKIIVLISDGIDSIYVEREYGTNRYRDIKEQYALNGTLIPGTELFNAVRMCKESDVKVYSLVINQRFSENNEENISDDDKRNINLGVNLLDCISHDTGGESTQMVYNEDVKQLFDKLIKIAQTEDAYVRLPVYGTEKEKINTFDVTLLDYSVYLTTQNNLRYIELPDSSIIDLNRYSNGGITDDNITIKSAGIEGSGHRAFVLTRPPMYKIIDNPKLAASWKGPWRLFDNKNNMLNGNEVYSVIFYDMKLSENIDKKIWQTIEPIKVNFKIKMREGVDESWEKIIGDSIVYAAITNDNETPDVNSEVWHQIQIQDNIVRGRLEPVKEIGKQFLHCIIRGGGLLNDLILIKDQCLITVIQTENPPTGYIYKGEHSYDIYNDVHLTGRPDEEITGKIRLPEGARDIKVKLENAETILDHLSDIESYKNKENIRIKLKNKGEAEGSLIYKEYTDSGEVNEYEKGLFIATVEGESALKYPYSIKINNILIHTFPDFKTSENYEIVADPHPDIEKDNYRPLRLYIESNDFQRAIEPIEFKNEKGTYRCQMAFNDAGSYNIAYTYLDNESRAVKRYIRRDLEVLESDVNCEFNLYQKEFILGKPIILKGNLELSGGTEEKRINTFYQIRRRIGNVTARIVNKKNRFERLDVSGNIRIDESYDTDKSEIESNRYYFEIDFSAYNFEEGSYILFFERVNGDKVEVCSQKELEISVVKKPDPPYAVLYRIGMYILNLFFLFLCIHILHKILTVEAIAKISTVGPNNKSLKDWTFIFPKAYISLTCSITESGNLSGTNKKTFPYKKNILCFLIVLFILILLGTFYLSMRYTSWETHKIISIFVWIALPFLLFINLKYFSFIKVNDFKKISALYKKNNSLKVAIKTVIKNPLNVNIGFIKLPRGEELYVSHGVSIKEQTNKKCECIWGIVSTNKAMINPKYKCRWGLNDREKWCKAPTHCPFTSELITEKNSRKWMIIKGQQAGKNKIKVSCKTGYREYKLSM